MYKHKIFELLLLCLVLCLPDLLCSNTDSLALLTGTLRSLHRVACNNDEVSLSCPRGTTISIQVAQYGDSPSADNWICRTKNNETRIPSSGSGETSLPCRWPNSMQYSLLQTVVEACQKKPQCKFATRRQDFEDPCPSSEKYVEVRFKCRPYEFRTKTSCENESVALNCNPGSRVAILEAQYGRKSFEAGQCPQPPGVPDEDCLSPYATHTVIQQCHGKRRCEVKADSKTFGSLCQLNTRTYLKIVYTCVPLGVLESRYESPPEQEEVHLSTWTGARDNEGLFDDTGSPGERWSGEPGAIPPAPAVINPTLQSYPHTQPNLHRPMKKTVQTISRNDKGSPGERWSGEPGAVPPAPAVINPVLQSYPHNSTKPPQINENDVIQTNPRNDKESNIYTFVYVGIAVTIVFIVIATVVAVKCYYLKKTKRQTKSPDVFTTDVPNVFNDGISDIDNDIDVSHISGTFYDPIHPDMILYRDANRGSLRAVRPMSTIYPCAGASMYGTVDYVPAEQRRKREDEDKDAVLSPKSLSRYSTSQFYYG